MPHYLAIGVTKQEFMHSTLVELRPYDDAYELRRRIQDEQNYLAGIYTYEAVTTALANAFREKGRQPYKYRDKPILEEIAEAKHMQNLSDSEKQKYTEAFFGNLQSMQASFEKHHTAPGK